MPEQADTLIIGAGLCGLTAAYRLQQAGINAHVLEASNQVGGVIRSESVTVEGQSFLIEHGPTTFQNTGNAIMQLVTDLRINPQATYPAAKQRYLLKSRTMHALPMSPFGALFTPLLSFGGKCRILLEPFQKKHVQEPAVAEFITDRFGEEVLTQLATPFLSGVFAGDPKELSAEAVLGKLTDWEKQHGSVIGGAIAQAFASRKKPKAAKRPYQLLSFDGGMQDLPRALANALKPGTLHLQQAVTSVDKTAAGYRVTTQQGTVYDAKQVVFATPSLVAGELLKQFLPLDCTNTLRQIPYPPMACAHVAVREEFIPLAIREQVKLGFGVLIPRNENLLTLGMIFTNSLFPNRAPQGQILITCFIGGALHPDTGDCEDDTLWDVAWDEMARVLKTSDEMELDQIALIRWPRSIPQYTLGHQKRIARLTTAMAEYAPGVHLTGNYLTGISLNDCVKNAEAVAETILTQVNSTTT